MPEYGFASDMVYPSPENMRLEELNRLRGRLETDPNYRDYSDEGPGFLERLGPLMLSQGLDLLTTEQALNQPGTREMNPLPGMQGFPGRLGAQILQTLLMDQIYKRDPKIGKAGIDASTALHSGAALGNAQTTEDQRLMNLRGLY